MPVRNEAPYVEKAVRDALAQSGPGLSVEVLVAVGPSHDGTEAIVAAIARAHPEVRSIPNPAGVVPHGLNAAIRASKGDHIVRMDAHSRYPADYVAVLIEGLERLQADNVGGVWETMPANGSDKAWAIAKALSSRVGVGNAMFRLGVKEEREVDTVPYGCFRRELFDRIGFFDEELLRNQDDEHNGRIIRNGGRIHLLPQVRIQYYGRDTIGKLWRMYREYGLFKPLVNMKLGAPATVRQFVPPLFVLGIFGLLVLGVLHIGFLIAWACLMVLYFGVVKLYALRTSMRAGRLSAFPWLVLALLAIHVAYGVGYLHGIIRFMILRKRVPPAALPTNR